MRHQHTAAELSHAAVVGLWPRDSPSWPKAEVALSHTPSRAHSRCEASTELHSCL